MVHPFVRLTMLHNDIMKFPLHLSKNDKFHDTGSSFSTRQFVTSRNCLLLWNQEIKGSHGSEYKDGCLLGCSTMQSGRSLPTFQSKDLWKFVNFYKTTQHNPEDSHICNQRICHHHKSQALVPILSQCNQFSTFRTSCVKIQL
jgi:hypothetical protein